MEPPVASSPPTQLSREELRVLVLRLVESGQIEGFEGIMPNANFPDVGIWLLANGTRYFIGLDLRVRRENFQQGMDAGAEVLQEILQSAAAAQPTSLSYYIDCCLLRRLYALRDSTHPKGSLWQVFFTREVAEVLGSLPCADQIHAALTRLVRERELYPIDGQEDPDGSKASRMANR